MNGGDGISSQWLASCGWPRRIAGISVAGFQVAEKAGYKLCISKKKKQKVVSVYLSICSKQIDALLATMLLLLYPFLSAT